MNAVDTIERAYYKLIDKVDPDYKHIGRAAEWIESKGVPSLPVFAIAILLLISLPFLLISGKGGHAIQIQLTTPDGTPIADQTVYLCGAQFHTDSAGRILLQSNPCTDGEKPYVYADGFEGVSFEKLPEKITLSPEKRTISITVAGNGGETPEVNVVSDTGDVLTLTGFELNVCYAPVKVSGCLRVENAFTVTATDGTHNASSDVPNAYAATAPNTLTLYLEAPETSMGTLQIRTNIDDGIAYIYSAADYTTPKSVIPLLSGYGETQLEAGDYTVVLVPYLPDGTQYVSGDLTYDVHISAGQTAEVAKDITIPENPQTVENQTDAQIGVKTSVGHIQVPTPSSGKIVTDSEDSVKLIKTVTSRETSSEQNYTLDIFVSQFGKPTTANVIITNSEDVLIASGTATDGLFSWEVPEGDYKITVTANEISKTEEVRVDKDLQVNVNLSTWAKVMFVLSGAYDRVNSVSIAAHDVGYLQNINTGGAQEFEVNVPLGVPLEITITDKSGNVIYQNTRTIHPSESTIRFPDADASINVVVEIPEEVNGISFLGVFDENGNKIRLDRTDALVLGKNYEMRLAFSMPEGFRTRGAACYVIFKGNSAIQHGNWYITNPIKPMGVSLPMLPNDGNGTFRLDNIDVPYTGYHAEMPEGKDLLALIPYDSCVNNCSGIIRYRFNVTENPFAREAMLSYRILCLKDLRDVKRALDFALGPDALQRESLKKRFERIYWFKNRTEQKTIDKNSFELPVTTEDIVTAKVSGTSVLSYDRWWPCPDEMAQTYNEDILEELNRYGLKAPKILIKFNSHTPKGAPVYIESDDAYILGTKKMGDDQTQILGKDNRVLDVVRNAWYCVQFLPKSNSQATVHIKVYSEAPSLHGFKVHVGGTLEIPMWPGMTTYEDVEYQQNIGEIKKEAKKYFPASWVYNRKTRKAEPKPPTKWDPKQGRHVIVPMKPKQWYLVQIPFRFPADASVARHATLLKGEITATGAIVAYNSKLNTVGLEKRFPTIVNGTNPYDIDVYVMPTGTSPAVAITFNGEYCEDEKNSASCKPVKKVYTFPVETPKLKADVSASPNVSEDAITLTFRVSNEQDGLGIPAVITVKYPAGKQLVSVERVTEKGHKEEEKTESRRERRRSYRWVVVSKQKTVTTDANGIGTVVLPPSVAGKTVRYSVAAAGYQKITGKLRIPSMSTTPENNVEEKNASKDLCPNMAQKNYGRISLKYCKSAEMSITATPATPVGNQWETNIEIHGLKIEPIRGNVWTTLKENTIVYLKAGAADISGKIYAINYSNENTELLITVRFSPPSVVKTETGVIPFSKLDQIQGGIRLLPIGQNYGNISILITHEEEASTTEENCENNMFCTQLEEGTEYCIIPGTTQAITTPPENKTAEGEFTVNVSPLIAHEIPSSTAIEIARKMLSVEARSELNYCRIDSAEYNRDANTLIIHVGYAVAPSNKDGKVYCSVLPKKPFYGEICGKWAMNSTGIIFWLPGEWEENAERTQTVPEIDVVFEDVNTPIIVKYVGAPRITTYVGTHNERGWINGSWKIISDRNSIDYTVILDANKIFSDLNTKDSAAIQEMDKRVRVFYGTRVDSEYNTETGTYTATYRVPVETIVTHNLSDGSATKTGRFMITVIVYTPTTVYIRDEEHNTWRKITGYAAALRRTAAIPNMKLEGVIAKGCKPSPGATVEDPTLECTVQLMGGARVDDLNVYPRACLKAKTEVGVDGNIATYTIHIPKECAYVKVYSYKINEGFTDVNASVLLEPANVSVHSSKGTVKYEGKITATYIYDDLNTTLYNYFKDRTLATGTIRLYPEENITVNASPFKRPSNLACKAEISEASSTVYGCHNTYAYVTSIYEKRDKSTGSLYRYPIFPTFEGNYEAYSDENYAIYRGVPIIICVEGNEPTPIEFKDSPTTTEKFGDNIPHCDYSTLVNTGKVLYYVDKLAHIHKVTVYDLKPASWTCLYRAGFQIFWAEPGCHKYIGMPEHEDANALYVFEFVKLGRSHYIPVLAETIPLSSQRTEENTASWTKQLKKVPGAELVPAADGPYYYTHDGRIAYDSMNDRPEYTLCNEHICNWEGIVNAIYRMANDGVHNAQLLFSPGATPTNYTPATHIQLIRDQFDLGGHSAGKGIVVQINGKRFCVEDWPAFYVFTSVPGLKFTPGFAGNPAPAELNVVVYSADAQEVTDTFGRDLSNECDYVVWTAGQKSIVGPSGYDYYGIMLAKSVGHTMDELPEDVKDLAEKYPIEAFYWVDDDGTVHGGYVKNCIIADKTVLDTYAQINVWGVGTVSRDEYVQKYDGLPYWVRDVPDCQPGNAALYNVGSTVGYVTGSTIEKLEAEK